jgi:alpha,alpha-trehalase
LAIACALACNPGRSTLPTQGLTAGGELRRLFAERDRDGDGRITVRDQGTAPLAFVLHARAGELTVTGPGRLTELADLLSRRPPNGPVDITPSELSLPRERVYRALVTRSWSELTRRADRISDLVATIRASNLTSADARDYVYVPDDDAAARERLEREAKEAHGRPVVVVPLPRKLDAAGYQRLDRDQGVLYLPHPYVVPGGFFQEMFGWDSYFMARGAMADGRLDLAEAMLRDLLYQIEHYGKIGNSTQSIHRGRSQPPLLARLALAVTDAMPPGAARSELLRRTAAAGERELREVWMAPPRITDTGLSRYHDEAHGPLPELANLHYREWRDTDAFFDHQRAVRESGWDMSHRFADRGHLLVPVCLNTLLYGYERDLAEVHRRLDGPNSSEARRWDLAAESRRRLIDATLWDSQKGLYFDWDIERKTKTDYETVASFYALWVGMASPEQARRIAASLPLFETPGGLAVSSERSRRAAGGEDLQWDWPNGWAPHQIIAVEGLRRYGFQQAANRIAEAWVSMVLDEADAHDGLIKEKYDVVHRSADVPAEYGNQGGDRGTFVSYVRSPACRVFPRPIECVSIAVNRGAFGFGWTNASLELLTSSDSRGSGSAR